MKSPSDETAESSGPVPELEDTPRWLRRRPFCPRQTVVCSSPTSNESDSNSNAPKAEREGFELDLEAVIKLICGVEDSNVKLLPSSPAESLFGAKIRRYLLGIIHDILDVPDGPANSSPPVVINPGEYLTCGACVKLTNYFLKYWLRDGKSSYFGFEGLLLLLELSLSTLAQSNYNFFRCFFETLSINGSALQFFRLAIPVMVDSAMLYHTDYIDLLLKYLSIFEIRSLGKTLALSTLCFCEPGLMDFNLFRNEKTLEEKLTFLHMAMQVRERPAEEGEEDPRRVAYWKYHPALSNLHFPERRIVVSNAPPVKLKRRNIRAKAKFGCEAAAGGLVHGLKPSLDSTDVWIAYLDPALVGMDKFRDENLTEMFKDSGSVPKELRRNVGLPRMTLIEDTPQAPQDYQEYLWERTEHELLSVNEQLKEFSEKHFTVNPLIIMNEDHTAFYSGISNGLLWPALHGLPEFILDEYLVPLSPDLDFDWMKYIQVNHFFAIHTAREGRSQDFLWIHDYHLILVGWILRALEPNFNVGFFLHIPFNLTDKFFAKFPEQAVAMLLGLLAFSRLGFQTRRDCLRFQELVAKHVPTALITPVTADENGSQRSKLGAVCAITYMGFTVDVGAFPISIKPEKIRLAVQEARAKDKVSKLRQALNMTSKDATLFLSVERFDYTKGIKERVAAIDLYFEEYPDRVGLDVFYQVAASSRSTVPSYREYQDKVEARIGAINAKLETETWKPIILITTNVPHEDVAALYMAANVIVVTPRADGMNLVIKEAVIANPSAVLMLSTGAGAEDEFTVAGLRDNYVRVENIYDPAVFAKALHECQLKSGSPETLDHGNRLQAHVAANDIQKWLDTYFDATWTTRIIARRSLTTLNALSTLMAEVRTLRRQISSAIVSRLAISDTAIESLTNAVQSLEEGISDAYIRELLDSTNMHHQMNIRDEVLSLKKDMSYLAMYQNQESFNSFVEFLAKPGVSAPDASIFLNELKSLASFLQVLCQKGINILITDWDGTLKTYASNYGTCMQTVYSAVILSFFASRFTGFTAVLTAGPLMGPGILDLNCLPDDIVTFGGSWGQEWQINGEHVINRKDISEEAGHKLKELTTSLEQNVFTPEKFAQFRLVGSGFQKKVDRINLGIQTVRHGVDEQTSNDFVVASRAELDKLDPSGQFFTVHQSDLDLEMILKKNTDDQSGFTKADGIDQCLSKLGLRLSDGNVLVCGDTSSDVPMVERALKSNPDSTFAIFVNAKHRVQERLTELLPPDRRCFVSCPEVIHLAMAFMLFNGVKLS